MRIKRSFIHIYIVATATEHERKDLPNVFNGNALAWPESTTERHTSCLHVETLVQLATEAMLARACLCHLLYAIILVFESYH